MPGNPLDMFMAPAYEGHFYDWSEDGLMVNRYDTALLPEELRRALRKEANASLDAFYQLSTLAAELAANLMDGPSCPLFKVVDTLLQISLKISGAEVASCRRLWTADAAFLIFQGDQRSASYRWADSARAVGKIADRKHRDDCHTRLARVESRKFDPKQTPERLAVLKQRIAYTTIDGSPRNQGEPHYSPEELAHFEWIGSEAYIPLMLSGDRPQFLLVLSHHDPDHFTEDRVQLLEFGRSFLNALMQLSDLAEDQQAKDVLLKTIAEVLPRIANADSQVKFARACCALLTCRNGYRFDRAMYFTMPNGQLPAECIMAIGGLDHSWASSRIGPCQNLNRLSDYIDDALKAPIPFDFATHQGDPLFAVACNPSGPVMYTEASDHRSEQLESFLKTGNGKKGPVEKLGSDDPWIAATQAAAGGKLFQNDHGEYFVFRLRPHDAKEADGPIGFIVADLPYRNQPHHPGHEFPNLAMAAFTLQLVAGLWKFRDDAASYFNVLNALPILRHESSSFPELIYNLELELQSLGASSDELKRCLTCLHASAAELSKAQGIITDLGKISQKIPPLALKQVVTENAHRLTLRYAGQLDLHLDPCSPDVIVKITSDAIESILSCLIDNAVRHGRTNSEPIRCEISWSEHYVSTGGSNKDKRILMRVRDFGRGIREDIVHFLFSDAVSTAENSGQGSGLSYARQIAKIYGGDVLLVDPDYTTFAVVLLA